MKAIVYDRYGPPEVLRLQELETPIPREDQVLVKVCAVSVNASDWEYLRGTPLYARANGLRRPRRAILGSDIAGRVEAIGNDVRRFRPGDEVFGDILDHLGGFAEYVAVPEQVLLPKPSGMSFETAAALPQAAAIALKAIRTRGRVEAGDRVLINGAGGGAGTFAVQLARLQSAHVTAVDNAEKLDLLRSLGADRVIDYRRQDFTRLGERYHLIVDVVAHRSVFAYQRALLPRGRCFIVGGTMASLLQGFVLGSWWRPAGRRVAVLPIHPNEGLETMLDLVDAGEIVPVIDRGFALEDTAAALRYLGEGHAKGKIVITP